MASEKVEGTPACRAQYCQFQVEPAVSVVLALQRGVGMAIDRVKRFHLGVDAVAESR